MNKIIQYKKRAYKIAYKLMFVCCFIMVGSSSVFATTINSNFEIAQIIKQKNVNLSYKKSLILPILTDIQKQSGVGFSFSADLKPETMGTFDINVNNVSVEEALKTLFNGSKYTYSISNGVILLSSRTIKPTKNSNKVELNGKVVDDNGEPIIGATVIIAGTTDGSITDENGSFTVKVSQGNVLEVSFIGMQNVTYTVSDVSKQIVIKMMRDAVAVDDVVVTGYFERKKESFTGAAKTVNGDQLRNISTTNIFNALSILDPSITVRQNNVQGSNPNSLPDIIIRGTSSLNTSDKVGVNAPLIVIDGVESTLRAMYDIDIFDIEAVTILKDASATALYGEQAANGVILVTRKKSSQKDVRISYNFTGQVQFPDLSDYSLMNASQKLEFERLSGLYDDKTGELYKTYVDRLARVNSGIDTDWLSKPLRNSFSHTHNVNVSGEGSGLSYQVTARYSDTNGVMKGDNRTNIGFGAYFSYNLNQKLIATLRADYTQNKTKASPYGSFLDFANANPYDSPYTEEGDLQPQLSHNLTNPLYEASLASLSTTKDKSFNGSLNVRWNVVKGFYVVGFGSLTSEDTRADQYTSPLSAVFNTITDPTKKGSYRLDASSNNSYLFKITANFNHNLDELGSMISLNAGGEIRKDKSSPYGFTTVGFFNDNLTDPTFGAGFKEGSKATGESSESATVAFVSAANIMYRNRYFIDGSYRLSGSSKFGTKQRSAPFWSVGAGWNINKEKWFEGSNAVNILRLRASYGHTGSIKFESYQAITTYRYASNLINKYGMGANPITMGNPDLKWQTTKTANFGLTSTWFNERLDVNVDYYNKRTVDMVMPISMPPSSSISTTTSNVGEQINKGIEVMLSGVVMKTKDLYWRLNFNLSHNQNELVKIGNALRAANDRNAAVTGGTPYSLYVEGESSTAIWVVRSAGIDPATGREIYIKKNGDYSFAYDPADKVSLGDTEPKYRGSMSSFLTYKGFSFNISMQYSRGGYIYNSTRASRIEQINPKYNADSRAFTDRWKKPGDVVDYLTILPNKDGTLNSFHSSRFVEKESYLNISFISLGYEFSSNFLKKIGFKKLNVGVTMNDVANFSTVKQERGTAYPFARGFSFTISPTF